jgi:hypothetical protein
VTLEENFDNIEVVAEITAAVDVLGVLADR